MLNTIIPPQQKRKTRYSRVRNTSAKEGLLYKLATSPSEP